MNCTSKRRGVPIIVQHQEMMLADSGVPVQVRKARTVAAQSTDIN
jgi:hypothetical protein